MDTYIISVIIALITMNLQVQPSHSNSIRKTRVASDFEDDPISRKIVTKSVFVAPSFECPFGYVLADNGECLNIVFISMYNQYDFVLSRLAANSEFYKRNKKNIIQIPETASTSTTTESPTTKAPQYYSIRPIKHKNKMVDRNTDEGPVRIPIPVNWNK